MLDYLYLYQDWGPFILRVTLGAAFVAHGYPKLFKGSAGFAGWLASIGFKPGKFWALVVGVVEFFGGIALILGVFTQLAAALVAINMLVAMAKVKWASVRYIDMEKGGGGWELDLIYFAATVALVFLGPGAFALDRYPFLRS